MMAGLPLQLNWSTEKFDFFGTNVVGGTSVSGGGTFRNSVKVHSGGSVASIWNGGGSGSDACTVTVEGLLHRVLQIDNTFVTFDTLTTSGLPWLESYSDSFAIDADSPASSGNQPSPKPYGQGSYSFATFHTGGWTTMGMVCNRFEVSTVSPSVIPPSFTPPHSPGYFPSATNWQDFKSASQLYIHYPATGSTCMFPITGTDPRSVTSVDESFSQPFIAGGGGGGGGGGDQPAITRQSKLSTVLVSGSPTPILAKFTPVVSVPSPLPLDPGCRLCSRAYHVKVHWPAPIDITIEGDFQQFCPDLPVTGFTTYPTSCRWRGFNATPSSDSLVRRGPLLWMLNSTPLKGGDCPESITEAIPIINPSTGMAVDAVITITPIESDATLDCHCDGCRKCTTSPSAIALKIMRSGTSFTISSTSKVNAPCKFEFDTDSFGYYGKIEYDAAGGDRLKLTLRIPGVEGIALIAYLDCDHEAADPILSDGWVIDSGSIASEVTSVETF